LWFLFVPAGNCWKCDNEEDADNVEDNDGIVDYSTEFDHFTSFVVLLGAPFGENSVGGTIYWLCVGFGSAALVISIIVMVVYNIWYTKDLAEKNHSLVTLAASARDSTS